MEGSQGEQCGWWRQFVCRNTGRLQQRCLSAPLQPVGAGTERKGEKKSSETERERLVRHKQINILYK